MFANLLFTVIVLIYNLEVRGSNWCSLLSSSLNSMYQQNGQPLIVPYNVLLAPSHPRIQYSIVALLVTGHLFKYSCNFITDYLCIQMEGARPLLLSSLRNVLQECTHSCRWDILVVSDLWCIVALLIFIFVFTSVAHCLFSRMIGTGTTDGFCFADSNFSYCEILECGKSISLLELLALVCLVVWHTNITNKNLCSHFTFKYN